MSAERPSKDLFDVLKCPITYELFRDPVIGSDGHTYERENITAWIQKHSTSPITREPMDVSSLRSNYAVKKLVEDFVSSSKQKHYEFRLNIDVSKAKPRPIFQSANKTIYEGQWKQKQGPSIVLIKIDGARAQREASFYVKLSCHPHIVRTYGLIDSDSSDSIMLVQEYAPQGDLRELLHDNNFRPSDAVFVEIFCQIVDAMICLADNQIIHGDLACRNVLVFRSSPDRPSQMLVKLTDFGLTRTSPLFAVIDSPGSTTAMMIPVRQTAPEILADPSSASYSEKSDVYSFGVLMWEAYSYGAVPYKDLKTLDEVYRERRKGKTLEQPSSCPDELWEIALQCMRDEVSMRPTFKMVQEMLLELKFLSPETPSRRTSTIRFNPETMRRNSSHPRHQNEERPHRRTYDGRSTSKENNTYEKLHRVSAPQIVTNSSNTADALPHDSTKISNGYYVPCDYCLQSIGVDGFNAHINVCPIRRLISAFVKMVLRLPLIDITSCPSCDELIPVNLLRIHQSTCNQSPLDPAKRSLMVDSTPSANVTITYLHPVSLQDVQKRTNIVEYANITPEGVVRPTSNTSDRSDFSDESPSVEMYTSAAVMRIKPPKSGFRKALSKLKKKM